MGNQDQTVQLSREKTEAVDRILSSAHAGGRNMLYEHEVYEILKITGANIPVFQLIRNESEITPEILSCYSSDRIVVKGAAGNIAHKQKAGAVKIVYKDLGLKTMEQVDIDLSDIATAERKFVMEGRNMISNYLPDKTKIAAYEKALAKAEKEAAAVQETTKEEE